MDNDNYNDNYYEEFEKKPHGLIYKIITRSILIFVIIFAVFLFARIHINNHAPDAVEKTLWDEEAYSSYISSPDDFRLMSYNIESYYEQSGDEQVRVVRNVMTKEENVKFSAVEYMPDVEKLQFTVRYNEATAKKYKTTDEGETFIFVLRDESGNSYEAYSYKSFEQDFLGRRIYNYRRLVYDGINLDETEILTLYVYDINLPNAKDNYIDSIVLYDSHLPLTEKEITPAQGADTLTPAPFTRGLS